MGEKVFFNFVLFFGHPCMWHDGSAVIFKPVMSQDQINSPESWGTQRLESEENISLSRLNESVDEKYIY